MQQVSIVVAKDQIPNLLAYAGSRKLLHLTEIEDEEIPEGSARYETTELALRASAAKNRVTALTSALEVGDLAPEKIKAPINNLTELAKFLDEETLGLEKSVREIEDEQGKLQTQKERATELSRLISGLEGLGVSLDEISGSGFLTSLVGEAPIESIPPIQKELENITSGNIVFAIANAASHSQTFIAIIQNNYLEDAKRAIAAFGAKPSPPWTDLPSDPGNASLAIQDRTSRVEEQLKDLETRKTTLAREKGATVRSLAILSEILDARARALGGSSSTESTALIKAWVPARKTQEVSEEISKACNGLASTYIDEPAQTVSHDHAEGEHSTQDDAPTLVRSPAWTKPLQGIIDNFGIPSYRETNPLPFMIITFPLIFGMMFGDIGGGLIFLLFGIYLYSLKRKNVKVGDISRLFVSGAELIIMLGIGTIIAGFVFGDFFGLEASKILGINPLFSPVQGIFSSPPQMGNLLLYMEFILLFGVAHYLSGLGINAYNKIRNKEYRHALLGPISWAVFYAAFIYAAILVVTSNFKFTVLLNNPLVLGLVFIPLGLMGYGEGGLHVMEAFIGAGSNTLSYLRIWALNLADYSVKFAFFTSFGIGGAIAGNLLVLTLEGLIVFVQTLRLHWVEWFGKFYEGTGHAFAPYQEPKSWIVTN